MSDESLTDIVIEGRPDFANPSFGVTEAKRHPRYVYSNQSGSLIHKVARVRLRWWKGIMEQMVRLKQPDISIDTVCGMFFFGGPKRGKQRSTMCEIPKTDAVLCGRCHGTGPVFGRRGEVLTISRREATRRIGCVVEVS